MNIKKLAAKYEDVKNRIDRHSSLQITDNREIIADGCRKVVSCDESVIIIDQARNRVTVTGSGLKLRNWGSDGVAVTGVINSVEYSEVKK